MSVHPQVVRHGVVHQRAGVGARPELVLGVVPGLDLHVVLGRDLVEVPQQQVGGVARGLALVDRHAEREVHRVLDAREVLHRRGRALGARDDEVVHEERRVRAVDRRRLDVELRRGEVGRHRVRAADAHPAVRGRVDPLAHPGVGVAGGRRLLDREVHRRAARRPRGELDPGLDVVVAAGGEQPVDGGGRAVPLGRPPGDGQRARARPRVVRDPERDRAARTPRLVRRVEIVFQNDGVARRRHARAHDAGHHRAARHHRCGRRSRDRPSQPLPHRRSFAIGGPWRRLDRRPGPAARPRATGDTVEPRAH